MDTGRKIASCKRSIGSGGPVDAEQAFMIDIQQEQDGALVALMAFSLFLLIRASSKIKACVRQTFMAGY